MELNKITLHFTIAVILILGQHIVFGQPPTPPPPHPDRSVLIGTVTNGNVNPVPGQDLIVAYNGSNEVIGVTDIVNDPSNGNTAFSLTVYGSTLSDGDPFTISLYEGATDTYTSLDETFIYTNQNGGVLPGYGTLSNLFDFNPLGNQSPGSGGGSQIGVPLLPYEWLIIAGLIVVLFWFKSRKGYKRVAL